jgi:hypothetical protein
MNFIHVASILFLCFLGLCAVSHAAPAPEETRAHPLSPHQENARKMWNGLKKVTRRLSRRVTRRNVHQLQQQQVDIPNIAGQKVIVDIYKNLTSTGKRNMEANTISSMDYNIGELLSLLVDMQVELMLYCKFYPSFPSPADSPHDCGQFNFSLYSLNETDYFIKADLMLYVDRPPSDTDSTNYYVEITAVPSINPPTGISESLKLVQQTELVGGYVVFPVVNMTKTLVNLGKKVLWGGGGGGGGYPHADEIHSI